jgi:hypothetical protein
LRRRAPRRRRVRGRPRHAAASPPRPARTTRACSSDPAKFEAASWPQGPRHLGGHGGKAHEARRETATWTWCSSTAGPTRTSSSRRDSASSARDVMYNDFIVVGPQTIRRKCAA